MLLRSCKRVSRVAAFGTCLSHGFCLGILLFLAYNISTSNRTQPSKNRGHKSSFTPKSKHGLSSTVSPIVHQSWKTRHLPSNRSKRWSNTWKTCFPNWEHRLWTDEDNLALVRNYYPWFLPVYMSFKNAVERADVSRYFYMFHYGGIYTDLDNVCLRNFEHLFNMSAILFGGMDGVNDGDSVLHTYVQNSFMVSRPRHPFWMGLISRVMLYSHMGKEGRPEYLTGPYILMDELREYITSMGNQFDVVIYESKYFNPFSWRNRVIPSCKDLGQMTDTEEKKCTGSFPDAYVVQFHSASWTDGRL